MQAWRAAARRAGLALMRRFGALCALAFAGMAARGAWHEATWAVIACVGWGALCVSPWTADRARAWAKGTRAPRSGLANRCARRLGPSFARARPARQAALARACAELQRAMWWEASATMWMRAHPGREHEWRCVGAGPGWFDDALAWRDEIEAKLGEAADRGWICPASRLAGLMGRPDLAESQQELREAIKGFAMLTDPWPGRAKYCDTFASMGRSLYGAGYAEELAGRSQGAVERMAMLEALTAAQAGGPPSKKPPRL